jgi:putative phosphoribosyl transferase
MFRDREEAALRLSEELRGRELHDPLVLAIPRGGVATGAILARELGTELDIVLARKLRAPWQRELAVGAVSEDGRVYLNRQVAEVPGLTDEYLAEERKDELSEIARRRALFRRVRPPARVAGRSVIVTDDGIATGSTMLAAVQVIRAQNPREIIIAVPVAPPGQLKELRRLGDEVICLLEPEDFWAISQFYEEFPQVEDEQVVQLLQESLAAPDPPGPTRKG